MESSSAAASASEGFFSEQDGIDESYLPLPPLYLGFSAVWAASAFFWAVNTWRNRLFQSNKLQWMLASLPVIKAFQLGSSFLFWYSCIELQLCSLWMSFGAYMTGVLFQTAAFVCFMLISHGYCIMFEHLSVSDRRSTAIKGLIIYLTLIGYKSAFPYFTVILMMSYLTSFYTIFRQISKNLVVLHEQMTYVEDEDIHAMQDAIHSKCAMFKKFQKAMQIVAVAEIAIHISIEAAATDDYWFQLFVREWAQFCIFIYIGWTFRSQPLSPHFFIVPNMKSKAEKSLPPVYSIEMDAKDFKQLASQAWQVGVCTSHPSACYQNPADSVLILVQNPRSVSSDARSSSSKKLSGIAPSTTSKS